MTTEVQVAMAAVVPLVEDHIGGVNDLQGTRLTFRLSD